MKVKEPTLDIIVLDLGIDVEFTIWQAPENFWHCDIVKRPENKLIASGDGDTHLDAALVAYTRIKPN